MGLFKDTLSELYFHLVAKNHAGENLGGHTLEELYYFLVGDEHMGDHSIITELVVDNETLVIEDETLKVNISDVVQEGDDRPVTSNAVYTVVGNIEALLEVI